MGVLLTGAVFQAKGRISRAHPESSHARSLGPLVRTRAFGMTPSKRGIKKHTPLPDTKNNLLLLRPFFIIESFLNRGWKL
jgi:hypothetical protein